MLYHDGVACATSLDGPARASAAQGLRHPPLHPEPSKGTSPWMGESSWLRDLTQDGDVEANPGPENSVPMNIDSPQGQREQPPPLDFQRLAPQFSSSRDPYAPHTIQIPDGRWFEQRPIPPMSLFSLASELAAHPVQVFFSGDGLPIPSIPAEMEVFDLGNQHQISPSSVTGKHSLIFLPRPLPFEDTPAVYSLRSWTQLLRMALQTVSLTSPTHVTLIIGSRFDSPTPTALPILDRRLELDMIRKFLRAIRILPECCLLHRNPQTGEIFSDRLPTPCPLMLFAYSSTMSFCAEVTCKVWPEASASPDLEPGPEDAALLVLLNVRTPTPPPNTPPRALTGLRLLMLLNGMSPDDSSTNFRNCSSYRYPPEYVPLIQRACPEGFVIAHYAVPAAIVNQLEEDTPDLAELGIEWGVISEPLAGSILVTHSPSRLTGGGRPARDASPQVRDSLLLTPSVARLLECTLLWSKWDVWARPRAGVALDVLAAQLHNLDNLSVTDAPQLLRVHGPRGPPLASPPHVLVSYPARLLPRAVLAQLAQLFAVVGHQPTQRRGLLLVETGSEKVASLLYGTVLSTPVGSITLTSGSDAEDTKWETSLGLERGASWEARYPLIQATDLPCAPLSAESLLAVHQVSSQSPPLSDHAPPRKVPAIFGTTPKLGATSSSQMQEN